jgi:hypothetical protein
LKQIALGVLSISWRDFYDMPIIDLMTATEGWQEANGGTKPGPNLSKSECDDLLDLIKNGYPDER